MSKIVLMGIALSTFALLGCVEEEIAAPSSQSYAVASKIMCGGIAGLQCPDGMHCLIKDNYPDAAGVCVGQNPGRDCSTVLCALPGCPVGFEPVQTGRNCCHYICKRSPDNEQDGSCQVPSDCDGLVHIMCVGSWSCEANQCRYDCDAEPL